VGGFREGTLPVRGISEERVNIKRNGLRSRFLVGSVMGTLAGEEVGEERAPIKRDIFYSEHTWRHQSGPPHLSVRTLR